MVYFAAFPLAVSSLQMPLYPAQPATAARSAPTAFFSEARNQAPSRTTTPSAAYSERVVGPACHKLTDAQTALASRPFGRGAAGDGDWYACTEPADDLELTCFLAPGWMGLPEGQWVCSSVHAVGHPEQEDLSADDGY